MYDNYNYPMGADNENAPWNEHEQDPIERECRITVTIEATRDVETKNYYQEPPEPWNGINSWNYDTSDVDWHEEYDNQYMSVPTLLFEMRKLLAKVDVETLTMGERRMYDIVLEESQGWEEVDVDVEKL